MNELIMQALPANALQLATLAGEINALNDSVGEYANKAIVGAVRLGDKLRQASQFTDGFDAWLGENCPRLKRSQAYNYMALAKRMPELLDESVHTTGHLLLPSQAIALLSAPEEVKTEVMERVEQGESVTVAEINEMKRVIKEQEASIEAVVTDRDAAKLKQIELRDTLDDLERENQAIKNGAGIDNLVRQTASAEIEKTQQALQQELDRVVAEHERDYQNKIDSLNDTVSLLKNDLVKANNSDCLTELNQQIADAQQELERTKRRRAVADTEVAYRGIATHIIETSATLTISLLELDALIMESATTELLMKAAHDLSGVVELLQKAATVEQFDIEG